MPGSVDNNWIITEGLNRGETIVAEGVQKVRDDVLVRPKPFAGDAEGR